MRKNWDSVFAYPVWARVFDTCPVESFKEGPLAAAFNRVKISDLNRHLTTDNEIVELCKFFSGRGTNIFENPAIFFSNNPGKSFAFVACAHRGQQFRLFGHPFS